MHYRIGATVYYERSDGTLAQGTVVDVKDEHVDILWVNSISLRARPYRYERGHIVLNGLHELCSDYSS
jgi:hypothetical protein